MITRTRIIAFTVATAFLFILFIPIPSLVSFSHSGYRISENNEHTVENQVKITARGIRWRSLVGFDRINGSIEIRYEDNEDILIYDLLGAYDRNRMGSIFWSGAHRLDPTLNRFTYANIYFDAAFSTFAVVIFDAHRNSSYYVASSDPAKSTYDILAFFRRYILI